jgi:hypothetical protein
MVFTKLSTMAVSLKMSPHFLRIMRSPTNSPGSLISMFEGHLQQIAAIKRHATSDQLNSIVAALEVSAAVGAYSAHGPPYPCPV